MSEGEIRYYMGKYKVRLLPKIAPKYKPNCRVFEALESFPCDTIEMMMNPGDKYMTSLRYLQKERASVANENITNSQLSKDNLSGCGPDLKEKKQK